MSPTTKMVILAGAVGTLLGASTFWVLGSRHKTAHPTAPETADVVSQETEQRIAKAAPLLEAAALRAAVREEVRAAVQDEAAAAQKQQAAALEAAKHPDRNEPAVPTPNYQAAHVHVEERLAQGSWSEKDRERIGDLLSKMSDRERTEIMRQVIVAANKGQLKVALEGPLF